MGSRMLQLSAAVLVGAVLVVGPAQAVTIAPGNAVPVPLVSGNTYEYTTGVPFISLSPGTASVDVFKFSASAAIAGVIDTTIAFGLGADYGFSKFDITWLNAADVVLASASFIPGGSVVNLGLPVAAAGIYRLVIDWATLKPPAGGGSYQTGLSVPGDRQELPLPPALLLFGSALVGLTVLGRRRRQPAAA